MVAPAIWRIDAGKWFEADGLDYIVQIAPPGTWDIESLPVGSDVLQCRFENAGWLLWRTIDVNGDATGGGASGS